MTTLEQRLAEAVPPVERIEMVSGFVHEEEADPMWRVNVKGYCTDFYTETAANNFRNAILSLASAPAAPTLLRLARP